jgi:hypothetical protein
VLAISRALYPAWVEVLRRDRFSHCQFAALLAEEDARWPNIVKLAGVKLD